MGNTAERVFVLVPAAGESSRMGLPRSKVFLSAGAECVLERSVNTLLRSCPIETLIVLARPQDMAEIRKLNFAGDARVSIAEGGPTRQESVWNGLRFLRDNLHPGPRDIVIVHDAARCLIDSALVQRVLEAVLEHGAVTAAVPSVDSLKIVNDEGIVEQSLNRSAVWAIQTPQAFSFELIFDAHERAIRSGKSAGAGDDAVLVEPFCPVHVVQGDRRNIKVTTREDLRLLGEFVN